MGQNRYMQDNQQLRQQDNGARQRKQPDEFKFRVGGRIRGVPLIVRFNYRVRQHEGDQAYKNHDLESFAGHDRVDRTTQPCGMQVAWAIFPGPTHLSFSIGVCTSVEFLVVAIPSAISTLAPGAIKPWCRCTGAPVITGVTSVLLFMLMIPNPHPH